MKLFVAAILLVALASALPYGNNPFGIDNRIAGGNDAERGQFPFQVGVSTRKRNEEYEYNAWCGGSLITDQLVVTAAHCLDGGISSEIYLGATDLSKNEPGRVIMHVPKENLIIHEKYNRNRIRDDIALIKLPQKVELNEFTQTVNLPKRSQMNSDFVKQVGWISGWGRLGDGKDSPEHLQYTRRWILPLEYCDDEYHTAFHKETQVCVDGSHGMSACSGDSGGPLTVLEEDGTRTLVGATSYGRAFCEKGIPVVYTRVSAYLDWIAEKGGIQLRD